MGDEIIEAAAEHQRKTLTKIRKSTKYVVLFAELRHVFLLRQERKVTVLILIGFGVREGKFTMNKMVLMQSLKSMLLQTSLKGTI